MIDTIDKANRSLLMANVKGKNTAPELLVRKRLHRLGFRFALHDKKLSGRPDLVLPRHQAVVFVHGCFWHRHSSCAYATTPATRAEFWFDKFQKNVERDARNISKLKEQGWRVFVVWECGLKHEPEKILKKLARGIKQKRCEGLELPETPSKPMK